MEMGGNSFAGYFFREHPVDNFSDFSIPADRTRF
jgi:hypothetical protein